MNRYILLLVLVLSFIPQAVNAIGLETDDKTYSLEMSGFLTMISSYQILDSTQNETDIDLSRARLIFVGKSKPLDLQFRLHSAFEDGGYTLKDALIEYFFFPHHSLQLGQRKVPFGLQQLISSRDLAFIGRSRATYYFQQDRDIGILFSGQSSFLQYWISITNGSGANQIKPPREKMSYAFRLAVGEDRLVEGDLWRHENELLSFGLNYVWRPSRGIDTTGDANPDLLIGTDVDSHLLGGDFIFKTWGFALQAELFTAWRDPDNTASFFQIGGYGQANYLLTDNFEVGSRLSFVNEKKNQGSDEITTIDGVLSYYFKNVHSTKTQLQYSLEHLASLHEINHTLQLLFQVAW
jgi:hypothetical protein